jgi:serine protease Do
MDDIKLLEAVERYIKGEMNPDERLFFENLRKTSTEVDQLVVEHTLFLQQMNRFGEWKKFRSNLHDVHTNLAEEGKINSSKLSGRAKVVYLWKRYKRVTAIAASIAGITAIGISVLVNALNPKTDNSKITELSRKVDNIQQQNARQGNEIDQIKTSIKPTARVIPFKAGGSGFLVDGKGYLVTNAHIIRNSRNIVVINSKNEQFNANLVKVIPGKDIAILKINDESFKPMANLPYGIRKAPTDVAEPLFTVGFPGNQIVYTEGYLSARTGYNGDTLSCRLGIDANRGNSGGPVFNRDGEVIGIISSKETESEGVAFAIQSKYIYEALEDLKKDTTYRSLKIPAKSTIRGLSTSQQFKKIEDYVFMVKGD